MVLAQVGTEQQGDLVLLADELDGGERLAILGSRH